MGGRKSRGLWLLMVLGVGSGLLVAPLAQAESDWRVGTTVEMAATTAPDTPTAYVPAMGFYGGPLLWGERLSLLGVVRLPAPVPYGLSHGRFDLGGGLGWQHSLRGQRQFGALWGAHLEVGYTSAFSDIQEGYIRGPDAVEYDGMYGRGMLEFGAEIHVSARFEMALTVFVAGSRVDADEGARTGLGAGMNIEARF